MQAYIPSKPFHFYLHDTLHIALYYNATTAYLIRVHFERGLPSNKSYKNEQMQYIITSGASFIGITLPYNKK